MADGYQLRIHGYTVPAPLYTPVQNAQDFTNQPDHNWIGASAPFSADDDDDGLMAVGVLI